MERPLDRLIATLARLPGLGRRSAERAALALVRKPEGLLSDLQQILAEARATICCCDSCGGFTTRDVNPCALCSAPQRDDTLLCVVEEPGDILAFERAAAFNGRYHALHGKLSAGRFSKEAVEARLQALARRVAKGEIREVVLALSTDLEGDATAAYLNELLAGCRDLRITRLAFGLPVDSGVGYADPLTLKRAFGGRQQA